MGALCAVCCQLCTLIISSWLVPCQNSSPDHPSCLSQPNLWAMPG